MMGKKDMRIMQSTKIIQNNSKWIILVILLVFVTSFANAQVLFGPAIDKEVITENEVALLSITIYNDNNFEISDYLRFDSSENMGFLDSDEKIVLQEFGPIKPYEKEIINVRIKANNTKKAEGVIYGYYGINETGEAKYAFVARVKIEKKPIFIQTSSKMKDTDTGKTIFVDYKLVNSSPDALHNVAFEVIAPTGFEVRTEPQIYETVALEETIQGTFEIYPPLEAIGTQKIIISYGYFDINGPHYFEENFEIKFEQFNTKLLLGIVGIIVLAIAIFLYMGSRKSDDNKIKGSADKED
jgi:hypothetical protein